MNESTIQKQIIQYLSMVSRGKFVFFSVPNEGIMAVLMAFKIPKLTCIKIVEHFKQMGLLKGVSDIVIIHDGRAYAMEVKTMTGKQSDAQCLFEQNIIESGGKYEVVRSVADVDWCLKEEWKIL